MVAAAEKRLREELGIETALQDLGKLTYHARYGDEGSENEVCHVLSGRYDGPVMTDPAEVSEYRWTGVAELLEAIDESEDDYAPWLVKGLVLYR